MDIHHLHIFSAVYRHKSFTKAARQINISQPTVSEHIKNLEAELDCQLFDRIGKGIEPTRSAQKLLPKALQILEEVAQLKAELLGGADEIKGIISLGASTIPSTYLLPSLIKQFRKIYPDVFFKVKIEDSQKINQLIMENELFCGIVGAKADKHNLHYEPIFKDTLALVASPELIKQRSITLAELKNLSFIQREAGSGTRKATEENFARLGFSMAKKQIVAEFGSSAAIKEAAKCGLGATVVSRLAVSEEIKNNSLVEISLAKEKMERYFFLVHHKKRTLPSTHLKFCQFLKEKMSQLPTGSE